MHCFDVFNGDADGICALHQLRLAEPLDARLVTGIKRDIDLLRRVDAGEGDRVTVLDISLARNRDALLDLLARGAKVRYFDHHAAGEVPSHPGLEAHIDESAGVCTSILVDRYLQGRYRPWAVAAAFGDGMPEAAESLAATLGLGPEALSVLRELGENLNYNAYGESEADLLVRPADLYRSVSRYADPFRMMEQDPFLKRLGNERREDLARSRGVAPYRASRRADAYILPDAPWARRVRQRARGGRTGARPRGADAQLSGRLHRQRSRTARRLLIGGRAVPAVRRRRAPRSRRHRSPGARAGGRAVAGAGGAGLGAPYAV